MRNNIAQPETNDSALTWTHINPDGSVSHSPSDLIWIDADKHVACSRASRYSTIDEGKVI